MFPPNIAPKDRPFYSEFLHSISNSISNSIFKINFKNYGQPAGYTFTDADLMITLSTHEPMVDYTSWFRTLFGAGVRLSGY